MLKEAYDLLQQQYERCMQNVGDTPFLVGYANEKYRHSMQVMGAGNYLIKRVDWLKNKPAEFIELVKTSIFLHDIFRFREIELYKKGCRDFDHGFEGGEFLRTVPLFNDIRIWLSIRHHGHLIGELYADADYQNITDKNLQDEVRQICFLIRDADKIANLHMVANEPKVWELFFGEKITKYNPKIDGKISEAVWQTAFDGTTVPRGAWATIADRVVSFLSWYMDINYQVAIEFCDKLNVNVKLLQIFDMYCSDEKFKRKYMEYFNNFLATHEYLK